MSRPSAPPREALSAYHQGEASLEAVVHSLIAYDRWVVPVIWMGWWRTTFGDVTIFSQETRLPASELWLFTDFEAANEAASHGAMLGAYATGPPGIEVFRRLNDRWTWNVRVNPCSPREATFFLSQEEAHLPTVWSDVFELEETLKQRSHPDPDARLKQVLDFRWYLYLLRKSDDAIVTFTDDSRVEMAPLFTGRDNVNAYLDRLYPTEQAREELDMRVASGEQVVGAMLNLNFTGRVVINPAGPAASFLIDLGNRQPAP
jgi:hypothetical protein